MGVVLQFPSQKIRSHSTSTASVQFGSSPLRLDARAGLQLRQPQQPAKRPAASLLMMTAPVASRIAVNARNMP